jgi:DNA repair exonuclease SbcCD ATPase subunit
MQVEKLSAELDAAQDQLAASSQLQSERDELGRRLHDVGEKSQKVPIAQDSSIPVDGLKELQSKNKALQDQLKESEENRNQFQNELQETRMELDGLKQNLEEAERIELQNEDLVAKLKSMSDDLAAVKNLRQQLKANESDMRTTDQLVRHIDMVQSTLDFRSLFGFMS